MNELMHNLERLGLSQYYENFVEEGFDSWDTVLYITEYDLDALNVKLGHRRRLQREIAYARGITFDQLLAQSNVAASSSTTPNPERGRTGSSSQSEAQASASSTGPTKRKYRRHPKPDENAPERPSSAYVIFSNRIRDELKPLKLSFTEIAKTVGERWQNLNPEEKEPYESKANSAKDVFNREMAKYKKTAQYREYMQYLAEFRAKNAGSSGGDGKRTRLDKEVSRPSSGSAGSPGEGGYESTALFRPPPLPSGPSASSTSSASPTSSLPPGGPPPPLPPPPPAGPVAGMPPHHLQQLPRIVPLEPGDAGHMSSIHPHPLESAPYSRPRAAARRTVGTVPAPFIRNDTSKSSVSSSISGGSIASVAASTGSSAFTPISPSEDGHYPQQRSGGYHRPTAPLSSLDRGHLPEHPLHPPSGGRGFSLPSLAQATATPPGAYQPQPPTTTKHYRRTSSPMKTLALEDDTPGGYIGSGYGSSGGIAGGVAFPTAESVASPRSAISVVSDRPEHSPRSEASSARDSSKMDPLSVLALAGNLMERRQGASEGIVERERKREW